MKILKILVAASLVFPVAFVAGLDQHGYNGKHGKNGRDGEDGEKGEDGGFYGGHGGNGGRGGKGGNGGHGGFFGGNGGNGGSLSSNMESGQINECEYKVLKKACRTVIAKVEERLAESGNLNPVVTQKIFQSELSSYLLPLETPAARKIYAEYEAVGWKYPAIKTI